MYCCCTIEFLPIDSQVAKNKIAKTSGEKSHDKNSWPQLPENLAAIGMKYKGEPQLWIILDHSGAIKPRR